MAKSLLRVSCVLRNDNSAPNGSTTPRRSARGVFRTSRCGICRMLVVSCEVNCVSVMV